MRYNLGLATIRRFRGCSAGGGVGTGQTAGEVDGDAAGDSSAVVEPDEDETRSMTSIAGDEEIMKISASVGKTGYAASSGGQCKGIAVGTQEFVAA